MGATEIMLIFSTVIMPILSGFGSYFMSTRQTKKDVERLREQNKLEIEKLMNQHKLDLEALERKHQMEVEKMELEHKYKIELMQKELEGKLGSDMMGELMSQFMKSPAIHDQINKAALQSVASKRRK